MCRTFPRLAAQGTFFQLLSLSSSRVNGLHNDDVRNRRQDFFAHLLSHVTHLRRVQQLWLFSKGTSRPAREWTVRTFLDLRLSNGQGFVL